MNKVRKTEELIILKVALDKPTVEALKTLSARVDSEDWFLKLSWAPADKFPAGAAATLIRDLLTEMASQS